MEAKNCNFLAIVLNTIKSDIMIRLLDVTLGHTAIDAICNLISGKDAMTRNESQLIIMDAERNSAAIMM